MAKRKKDPKKPSDSLAVLVRGVSQESKLAQKAEAESRGTVTDICSILEYIEAPWGLSMTLYPAQRFIVKLYYNIPLEANLPEDPLKRIKVQDPFGRREPVEYSEVEYLKYLNSEGRCNIGVQDLDHPRNELVLSIGRRAGKSTLSGIFASYEVYKLLNLYNPQEYYGLPNGNRIQIISVATDKDQAGILFNEVASHLNRCDYFKPYILSNTQSRIDFRTPHDIEVFGPTIRHEGGRFVSLNGKASLRVTFKSSVAKGLRGSGNIVVILDEAAHFQAKGGTSAAEVYTAVTPSTAAFSKKDRGTGRPYVDPQTGREARVEARIIMISSPLGRSGKFFEKFDLAMRSGSGSDNVLAIQAPTWEVNPTVPTSYYYEKYHEDPVTFDVEHGARFSDQVHGWIERESDLVECIDPEHRPRKVGLLRSPYQMGVDVGLVGDGTAICLTRVDEDRIVLDYHEVWYAKKDWWECNPHLTEPLVPYAKTLRNVDRLDFDEISAWIQALCKRFHVTKGLFDRWNGIPLEQNLHKRGLTQFQSEFFTRDANSKIFQAVKMLIYDRKLKLYDFPTDSTPEKRHCSFIAELLSLQANHLSKNVTLVEAPQKPDSHDDVSDAFTRSVWLSMDSLTDNKRVVGAYVGGGMLSGGADAAARQYQFRQAAMSRLRPDLVQRATSRSVRGMSMSKGRYGR